MLAELRVKSLGIIDELDWTPARGLNIITGETGAGKSLVIDAVTTMIDGRLDETSIRHGSDMARTEGVFCFSPLNLPVLAELLKDKGIEAEEGSLVLSGEFRRQGRAVFRLNGNAVTRGTLREAGHLLVDVHSQTEHLALFDRRNHLEYLEVYARADAARERFTAFFNEHAGLCAALAALDAAQADRARRREILSYQVDEIKRTGLLPDEEEELVRQRQVMASAEKLKALSYESLQALENDDGLSVAALSGLHRAREAMRRLVAIDPALKESLDLLEDACLNVEELVRDVQSYQEKLDFEPNRLEEVDSRLELLRSLKKKYGGSIAAAQAHLAQAEQELAGIASYDEDRAALAAQVQASKERLAQAAGELSRLRQKAARKLAAAVKKELGELNLEKVNFDIRIERRADPCGLPLPGGVFAFNRTGVDEVEFMVSTNPGEPLKPLADIASTGEVSRFTLALKVALAEADRTPVLIFDEIDIGVGGRSGEAVGQKLWRLARHHQVVCVTHLPQIAVYGDSHFTVHKESTDGRTVTRLHEVTGLARLGELAAMIGGASPGKPASQTAGDLMRRAGDWVAARSSESEPTPAA